MKSLIFLILLIPYFSHSQTLIEEGDFSESDQIKLIKLLKLKLKNGADFTKGIGKYKERPLYRSVGRGYYQVTEYLLEHNAHNYEPRKIGFRNDFPNPALHSTENSFMFMEAVASEEPLKLVDLLLKYIDPTPYLDEILFFSLGCWPKCFTLSNEMIELGAKPTTIFTIDELGGISNAIHSTLTIQGSKPERIKAHNILLNWVEKHEGLTKEETYKKYVNTMHSGPYDH